MARSLQPKFAVVNENTIANNEIVAAVAGMQIVVIGYLLVLGGDVRVTWKSGTTAISGPMDAGAAAVLDFAGSQDSPAFKTARGEALNLDQDAAVVVAGHVTYVEEPYG